MVYMSESLAPEQTPPNLTDTAEPELIDANIDRSEVILELINDKVDPPKIPMPKPFWYYAPARTIGRPPMSMAESIMRASKFRP